MAAEVLFPLNASGDKEGCTFENGVVRTPAGFKEAYRTFVEGGWTALACDPEYGGQGLPYTVSVVFEEMVSSANLAFGMYPGLSHGAAKRMTTNAEARERHSCTWSTRAPSWLLWAHSTARPSSRPIRPQRASMSARLVRP